MRVTINQIHIETGSKTETIESIYTDQLLERMQIDSSELAFLTMSHNLHEVNILNITKIVMKKMTKM